MMHHGIIYTRNICHTVWEQLKEVKKNVPLDILDVI